MTPTVIRIPNPRLLQPNCLISDENRSRIFTIEIPDTKTISALRESIKEVLLEDVDAEDVVLWKVSAPDDEYLEESLTMRYRQRTYCRRNFRRLLFENTCTSS